MKIGELSAASKTKVETIRFYEREGLMPAPARTDGNYRSYDQKHLARLQFIRFCRSLDMSLDEVQVLLRFKDDPSADCGDVNDLLDEHIGHVTRRIKELRQLEKMLIALRQLCSELHPTNECGILTGLADAAQESKPTQAANHLRTVHRD